MSLTFNLYSQDIEEVVDLVDSKAYFLSFRAGNYVLTNVCDTLTIPKSNFSQDEEKALKKISVEQRKLRQRSGKKYKDILKKNNLIAAIEKKADVSTRFIIRKDSALSMASNNILDTDTLNINRSRHSVDGVEIIYYARTLTFADTVLLRSKLNIGNITHVTYFEKPSNNIESLRNFVNDPQNGWFVELEIQ